MGTSDLEKGRLEMSKLASVVMSAVIWCLVASIVGELVGMNAQMLMLFGFLVGVMVVLPTAEIIEDRVFGEEDE